MKISDKLKNFLGIKNNKQKDKENNSQESIKKIKTKNDERNKLNELALDIDKLCENIKKEIDKGEISNDIAKAYSEISVQLYSTIMFL